MNKEQREVLLRVARDTIRSVVNGGEAPEASCEDAELNAKCGCFVTIKNREELRGCIGQFVSDGPLIKLVGEMARESATDDPRFFTNPIRPRELDKLDIEISVLSPLVRTRNPLSLRPGVDGVYIRKGYASGCFLPQVATETGWDAEEFLSYCCAHKAGLAADAWKDPETEVYFFTAEIFGGAFNKI